jgi:hypothetical protein
MVQKKPLASSKATWKDRVVSGTSAKAPGSGCDFEEKPVSSQFFEHEFEQAFSNDPSSEPVLRSMEAEARPSLPPGAV